MHGKLFFSSLIYIMMGNGAGRQVVTDPEERNLNIDKCESNRWFIVPW
jgi:hypothetical protein